jgi:hypothetical protein
MGMTRAAFNTTARRIVFGTAFAAVLAVGCGETNPNPPLPPGSGGFAQCITNGSTTDAGGTTAVDGGNSSDDGGTVACDPYGNGNGTGNGPTTTAGNGGTASDGGIGTGTRTGTGRGPRRY